MTIVCQYCLDRQIEEPEEAIGIYQKRPIGELCLGVIMDNDTQVISEVSSDDPTSLAARKTKALAYLAECDEKFDENWWLYEDEVLLSRDDFFNHKPPALINLTVDQIKQLISRRKARLFAYKIQDEYYTELINRIRIEERREAGLKAVTKSVKEKVKTSSIVKEKNAKIAKGLNISPEVLQKLMDDARAEEFKGVKGKSSDLSPWELKPKSETRESLENLKHQIAARDLPPVSLTAKVTRCQVCKKLTCICPRG